MSSIWVRLRTKGVTLRVRLRGVSPRQRLHNKTLKEEQYFVGNISKTHTENLR